MSFLIHDLRIACRRLVRQPAFTAVAVLTLALGIGANTAIFSVVKTVLLDPLPYPDSGKLVVPMGAYPWMPVEIVQELGQHRSRFEQVSAYYPEEFTVTGTAEPLAVEGVRITPDLLGSLGGRLAAGRGFQTADARTGAEKTVILDHGFWQRRFGGEAVTGRTLRVNGEPHRIIGVLAPGFRLLAPRSVEPQIWLPLRLEPLGADGRLNWAIPLARLASGVDGPDAEPVLDATVARFRADNPGLDSSPATHERDLVPLRATLVEDARPALLVLQAAVVLVLLLAAVNVANLMLARIAYRRRELAVRAALGATGRTLTRQVLVESVTLSLLGAIAGLAVMHGVVRLVLGFVPEQMPRLQQFSLDHSVLAFAAGLSLVIGVTLGLFVAATANRREVAVALGTDGRSGMDEGGRHCLAEGLVATQIMLTLVLLAAAGLLGRSFVALATQDPGFRTEGVQAIPLRLTEERYRSVDSQIDFFERAADQLRRVPGVETAAYANNVPLSRGGTTRLFHVEGQPEPEGRLAQFGVVSPGYFETLDIPLLRGRLLQPEDRRDGRAVAVIDRTLWQEVWPDFDPLGRRLQLEDDGRWFTVVGVVDDIRGSGLAEASRPGFYIPNRQRPDTLGELGSARTGVFLLRSALDHEALAGPLREAIWRVDPNQPVPEITPLERLVTVTTAPQRFRTVLMAAFALTAMALAVAGVYGVLEFLLSQRRRELAVRRAVGATSADIMKLAFGWGLRVVGAGIALGLLGILAFGRFLSGLLHGVTPGDPLTAAGAAVVVLLAALAACLMPARRAARLDPMRTLGR